MVKLPAQDIVERLLEAMDGVTPGPWFEGDKWVFVPPLDPKNNASSALRNILRDVPEDELQANCAYITLCSPDNIGALLDTISRLTADNEALRKDNARLSEEKDALAFGMRHGQSLSEDAIHAIRELLNEACVPLAAFIDDHVGNAIAQRNEARARADALAQEVERLRGLLGYNNGKRE